MPSRREFLGEVLGLIGAGALTALPLPGRSAAPARDRAAGAGQPQAQLRAHGSGHFGEWMTDEFGLPAYRYTCDQLTDRKASTPVHTEWRSATDHTHQVGNDRLVAAVSNYGYVQVRQDEGSPKFLNDYAPEHGRYGGGIGFLTDGTVSLSTYYTCEADTFDRTFGAGYFRKTVARAGYEVDQVIVAPFGDDPVLISQVRISNRSSAAANLRWIEYWGCHPYQFSYRSLLQSPFPGGSVARAAALRRKFADRFAHEFRALRSGAGLIETKKFLGRGLLDEATWLALRAFVRLKPDTFMGGPMPELAPGAEFEDLAPPSTFLASLDAPADRVASSAAALFGAGGIARPSGLTRPLDNALGATGPDSALLIERALHLQPGESRTLHFLYGYQPDGFEAEELIRKYRAQAAEVWKTSSAAWSADGPRLRVPSEPWVERETTWHNYYLRSNLTYDSFFKEHILSQGNVYQYVLGFQAAARDPLQHALPFVFSRPQIVREVLRYTLKQIQPDGSIPYGIVGSGAPMPVIFRPSDLEMWLLWLASEYVLATRDTGFLDEKIAVYPHPNAHAPAQSVRELLGHCHARIVEVVGVGEHGLMRLYNGDWNDGVVGDVTPEIRAEITLQAESVLNAAMASYVLDHYSRMLGCIGDVGNAAAARAGANAQRLAVRAQWTGRWFRRAWLGTQSGWLGEQQMWLEPQPWAVIGGAATPEQSAVLTETLDSLVRRPSPIGAMLHSAPVSPKDPGVLINGGVWPSINGTLIWALARTDPVRAWDEWKKNSLAAHAEAYPQVWYGIWSGPDSYNSVLSRHPGQTMFIEPAAGGGPAQDPGLGWTDFPVMNMHPHAWPLYSAVKLLGLEFTETGFSLRPALPPETYEFSSALFGFKKTATGYSGWYSPAMAGTWSVELNLPSAERARLTRIEINGARRPLESGGDSIRFSGTSEPGKALRWALD